MGLVDFFFKRTVAQKARDAAMGKLGPGLLWLWNLLNGWKTLILAVVLITEQLFPGLQGVFHYVDLAIDAVGWHNVVPAIDPTEFVKWVWATLAIGHKIVKAIQQIRQGIPVVDVHP